MAWEPCVLCKDWGGGKSWKWGWRWGGVSQTPRLQEVGGGCKGQGEVIRMGGAGSGTADWALSLWGKLYGAQTLDAARG